MGKQSVRPNLSLVMPAYNEADGIVHALAEAHEALVDLDYRFEIIVVDDGSTDRTSKHVEDLALTSGRIRLLRHHQNLGYGAALRTGFEAARYDRVAFTDADGQFYLEDLELLMPLTRDSPVVTGFRVDRHDPWRRRFFSWGYNKLVRTLLGTRVRDCDCALKIFRREVLWVLMPESRGFFANAEMLCKANRFGLPVDEVGVRHRERRKGVSKVSLREIPRTLAKLIPFWWSMLWTPKPRPLVWPMPHIGEPLPRKSKKAKPRASYRPPQPR